MWSCGGIEQLSTYPISVILTVLIDDMFGVLKSALKRMAHTYWQILTSAQKSCMPVSPINTFSFPSPSESKSDSMLSKYAS